ncbi:hypothetical protein CYMTET_49062 [Cymbomonas tetramitiformis]|uniref:CCHC-type domain-containing protein n=1 Tax=Cymbomonas tetramitiformis TaxID=36881 RepID=A0AAE0EUX3_9CHLO|nr:hypothetical protein CYMTET_49062 [Cymbomonas tetramitiformis]
MGTDDDSKSEGSEDMDPVQKLIVQKAQGRGKQAKKKTLSKKPKSKAASTRETDSEDNTASCGPIETEVDEMVDDESEEGKGDVDVGEARQKPSDCDDGELDQDEAPIAATPSRALHSADAAALAGMPKEEEDGMTPEMRRLLRAPRYFDSDFENSSMKCFNCGGSGHHSRNCKNPRKRPPCHQCGSLEHLRQDCPNGLCFICNKPGHQRRDCPEARLGLRNLLKQSSTSQRCLKCGRSGHDMLQCTRDYLVQDLQLVQCFVCFRTGHLCCGPGPTHPVEATCYNCGDPGHLGPDCRQPSRRQAEFMGGRQYSTPPPRFECFKCGLEGHMARECTNAPRQQSGSHLGNMNRYSAAPPSPHTPHNLRGGGPIPLSQFHSPDKGQRHLKGGGPRGGHHAPWMSGHQGLERAASAPHMRGAPHHTPHPSHPPVMDQNSRKRRYEGSRESQHGNKQHRRW